MPESFGKIRIAVAAAFLLSTAWNSAHAQTPEDKVKEVMAALYEKAKDEGEIIFYTTLAAGPGEKILAAFQEEFPEVQTTLVRKTGLAIFEQFFQEAKAGVANADVLNFYGSAPVVAELIPNKYVAEYTPALADLYQEEMVVPGYAYPYFYTAVGVCYNTNKLSEADVALLGTYKGMTDARWKDQISMTAAPVAATSSNFAFLMAKEPDGEEWFKAVAALNPSIFASTTAGLEQVQSGEREVAFSCPTVTAYRAWSDGIPLGAVYQEWTSAQPNLTMIATNAPHPNAARLFQEWLLTDTGQKVQKEVNFGHSSRKEQTAETAPVANAPWYKAPTKLRVAESEYEPEAMNAEVPKIMEHWSEIFNWSR